MSDTRHFEAPWGTPLKLITGLASAFLAAFVILGLANAKIPTLARIVMVTLPPLAVAAGVFFTIRGYELTRDALFVERAGWRSCINLAGLRSARVDPEATRRCLRSCGNGGFFSFTGWFWNKALGHHRLFATDLERAVVLDLGKRRVVVTPDEPETFVRWLKEHAAGNPS